MVSIGPFQKIKAVHFPAPEVEVWIIIAAGTALGDGTDYVGQTDGVYAISDLINTTGPVQFGADYDNLPAATTAWDAIASDRTLTIAHRFLHWTKSTEFPNRPATPTAPGWVVLDGANGWLPWSAGFGQIGFGFPDPNCPPTHLNVVVSQASESHVHNYFNWQRAMGGGVLHASQSIVFQEYGHPASVVACVVGDP